jgi:hypothetical protein
MTTQELRDRNGYLLGTLYVYADYQEFRDRSGTYKGKYDGKNNETRDRHGTYIGTGNLLMTLL